jgi:hypothetical protein
MACPRHLPAKSDALPRGINVKPALKFREESNRFGGESAQKDGFRQSLWKRSIIPRIAGLVNVARRSQIV